MDLKVGCGRASGDHGANSVSQVDGDSDMALPAGSFGGGLRKGTLASARTSVW